jgi:hypothetical protein
VLAVFLLVDLRLWIRAGQTMSARARRRQAGRLDGVSECSDATEFEARCVCVCSSVCGERPAAVLCIALFCFVLAAVAATGGRKKRPEGKQTKQREREGSEGERNERTDLCTLPFAARRPAGWLPLVLAVLWPSVVARAAATQTESLRSDAERHSSVHAVRFVSFSQHSSPTRASCTALFVPPSSLLLSFLLSVLPSSISQQPAPRSNARSS